MARIVRAIALAGLIAAGLVGPAAAQATATTEETPDSLPDFKGREETFGYCIGCHSFKVVGRQGMDRTRWDETLSFMTEKHNMPAPDAETRKLLLDYLTQAYPPSPATRAGGWVSPFAPQR